MKNIKKILCFIKAVPFYIKTGVWCPHTYKDISQEDAIIISSNNSFRVAKDFNHEIDEIVHPKAKLIRSKCIYCGKEDLSWCDGEIPVI